MYYLYRHIRLDKDEPFYIGVGTMRMDGRRKCNSYIYCRAYEKSGRNKYWQRIVAKTKYVVEIMLEDSSKEFIFEKEKEFISIYKKRREGGTLCNLTKGGEGISGYKYTEEQRAVCSVRAKIVNPNTGKRLSETHRKRISEGNTGKNMSESAKHKYQNRPYGKLLCVETGQIFPNAGIAAKTIFGSSKRSTRSNICASVRLGYKIKRKYTFKWLAK